MSTSRTEFYADEVMQDPDSWYDGLKEAKLLHAGDAERPLSDPLTGAIQPATMKIRLDDSDGRFRQRFADPFERYWCDQLTHSMTSRPNRAVLGDAFDTFSGFPIAQFTDLRVVELTLIEALTRGMLSDEERIPWRKVSEGFTHLLDYISDRLDPEQMEPIILGRHTRTDPLIEPATPAAFPIIPIYLGIETVASVQRHVWLVAGHACKSVTIQVDGVDEPEGSDWLIATQANHLSTFGAHYVDKTSGVYGIPRRYSLIYGDFGATTPDECAAGDKQLLALVEGVEDSAVGTGTLITDYYQQYKHLVVNYVANPAHLGYQSGAYLTAPTGFRDNAVISTVYEPSFDYASTVSALRRPGGIHGAIALGLSGRGAQTAQVLAELNVNGFVRFGQPQRFQMGIVTLHPTQAAKDAAPTFSDVYEILKGSYSTEIQHAQHKNHIHYRGDYRHETGVHVTVDVEADTVEAANYKQALRFEREYRFIPGRTQMAHLAQLELRTLVHPPRMIRMDQTIGDTDDDNWLAYQNSGDYVKVIHFDAVGGRTERLHQIITPNIRGSARRASATALDVEDLIDFDLPVGT